MKYDPATVVERQFEVLPEGYYSFETISGKESVSKSSGNEMIVLDLKVFGNDGSSWAHKVYVTASSLHHLKNFWDSVGNPDMFEKMANDFDSISFIGKCGMLKTKHEESEKEGNKYTNSRVHYFIKKKDQEKINNVVSTESPVLIDDDIAF